MPLPAAFAQSFAPSAAQPADVAADWNEKDLYTVLQFISSSRLIETYSNKIRGFIVDLELNLQMSSRSVHHRGYFTLASLGTKKSKKVRRLHVAESVTDYIAFKSLRQCKDKVWVSAGVSGLEGALKTGNITAVVDFLLASGFLTI